MNDFVNVWLKDIVGLFNPIIAFKNYRLRRKSPNRTRTEVINDKIYVCIHEWGGYEGKRKKEIKNIRPWNCGLDSLLEKFSKYRGVNLIDLTITMSEIEKYSDINTLKKKCDRVIETDNCGMDFSGYNAFYDWIKNQNNSYVILANTSINEHDSGDFLLSYRDYLEHNKDIGVLGISCSSKYYHTLNRCNYNPHVQSFFLMTTIEILKEIVQWNNGKFPGKGITNKHLLIRGGEVVFSRAVLELGYNLAVVTEKGPVKFNYGHYPFPKGDYRLTTLYPNTIFSIKN